MTIKRLLLKRMGSPLFETKWWNNWWLTQIKHGRR